MAQPFQPVNPLPLHVRFEEAMVLPLKGQCHRLTELIIECLIHNPREIHVRYQTIVERIFAFTAPGQYPYGSNPAASTDWKLRSLVRGQSNEFNDVFDFLSVNGTFFKLIKNIMLDPTHRFDFPIDSLPANTVGQFKDGIVPHFYLNKFPSSSPNLISLNAFEFYMFHFAFYITNSSTTKANDLSNVRQANGDVLYHHLFQNYLDAFFPTNAISQSSELNNPNSLNAQASPSLWKAFSSKTSNILNLSALHKSPQSNSGTPVSKPLFNQTPKTPNTSVFRQSAFQTPTQDQPRLFSPALFSHQSSNNGQSNSESDPIGTLVYKSETLMNIFTEFWLNHASDRFQTSAPAKQFNFTMNHMQAVRILIKHFHHFASRAAKRKNENFGSASFINHSQFNSGGFVHSSFADPLDEFRANLWTSKYQLQRKLYHFMRLAFERWHNDSSFRIPLETWLSYIQPWRYVKSPGQSGDNNKENNDDNDTASNFDIGDWKRFIQENLFFYTVLFKQVLARIAHILDLNPPSAAHFLFRMTKVFNKQSLLECIRETELSVLRNGMVVRSSPQTPIHHQSAHSPLRSPNKSFNSQKSILIDLDPSAAQESVFNAAFREYTIVLVGKIAREMFALDHSEDRAGSKGANKPEGGGGGFMQSVWDFLNSSDTLPGADKSTTAVKTRNHLQVSIKNLTEILSIPNQSVDMILAREKSLADAGDNVDSGNDIYENVDGFSKLSEKGRSMVISGALNRKSFKRYPDANPDTQPAMSFEFAFLIRLTVILSDFVNVRFGEKLQQFYNDNSLVGATARKLLTPPTKYVEYVKHQDRIAPEMVVRELPARMSFRFLASKFAVYSSVFVYFMYTISPFSFLTTIVLGALFGPLFWLAINVCIP